MYYCTVQRFSAPLQYPPYTKSYVQYCTIVRGQPPGQPPHYTALQCRTVRTCAVRYTAGTNGTSLSLPPPPCFPPTLPRSNFEIAYTHTDTRTQPLYSIVPYHWYRKTFPYVSFTLHLSPPGTPPSIRRSCPAPSCTECTTTPKVLHRRYCTPVCSLYPLHGTRLLVVVGRSCCHCRCCCCGNRGRVCTTVQYWSVLYPSEGYCTVLYS